MTTTRVATVKIVEREIVNDLNSSLRHWREVRDAARTRVNSVLTSQPERWRRIALWELEVAQGAIRLIEHGGRAPRALVLGEVGEELGIPFPPRRPS